MNKLSTEKRIAILNALVEGGTADRSRGNAGEGDDLAWAKPYVDEARLAVASGDVLTLDEHEARNAARLDAIESR